MPNRILAFDEHEITRLGLKQLLVPSCAERLEEVSSCKELLEKLSGQTPWNVVIYGLGSAPTAGLKMLPKIKSANPKGRVLVYSSQTSPALLLDAVRGGADGFVTKRSGAKELIRALGELSEGRQCFSSDLKEIMGTDGFGQPRSARPRNLSAREFEILLLLAQGRTNTKIASDLSIHAKTVSSFKTRLMDKLGLRNNAELVQYAISQGYVSTDSEAGHYQVRPLRANIAKPARSIVQFYRDEQCLLSTMAGYLRGGLLQGEGALILAAPARQQQLRNELTLMAADTERWIAQGDLQFADAQALLTEFTRDGNLDETRFRSFRNELLASLKSRFRSVRIYEEMVNLMMASGCNPEARSIERIWNEFLPSEDGITLFRGYYPPTPFSM